MTLKNQFFKNIRPGHGTITFEKDTKKERSSKKAEYKEAQRLLKEFGGDFVILAESRKQGVSKPDIVRDKTEYIEIKHPSSLVAFDTRLREGISQMLHSRNRIGNATSKVIVLVMSRNISEKKAREIIKRRVDEVWKCELDAVIVRYANNRYIIPIS